MAGTHFLICTYSEAAAIISRYERYWAFRPPDEVGAELDCIYFSAPPPVGRVCHEIKRARVRELLEDARKRGLVAMAFKTDKRAKGFRGLCFSKTVPVTAAAGEQRPVTDFAECIHCGLCVKACQFDARSVEAMTLHLADEKCAGCGLCALRCPLAAIKMVSSAQ